MLPIVQSIHTYQGFADGSLTNTFQASCVNVTQSFMPSNSVDSLITYCTGLTSRVRASSTNDLTIRLSLGCAGVGCLAVASYQIGKVLTAKTWGESLRHTAGVVQNLGIGTLATTCAIYWPFDPISSDTGTLMHDAYLANLPQ